MICFLHDLAGFCLWFIMVFSAPVTGIVVLAMEDRP